MNVILLTPDRVGSSLLQRMITIYMLRRGFDKPVVNIHEITDGLETKFSPLLGQNILSKTHFSKWGYDQSLKEIVDLIESTNHYKTCRIAHYRMLARQESISDQLKFYEYLNKNFFVISCQRENLFEHVLSWIISASSKNLNVHTAEEKINKYSKIYQDGITATEESVIKYANRYRDYLEWTNKHFDVQSYFYYEKHVADIEKYVLGLDFMTGHTNNTWKDMFGQEFQEWNACHRLLPNLMLEPKSEGIPIKMITNLIGDESAAVPEITWNQLRGHEWPATYSDYLINRSSVPMHIQQDIESRYSTSVVKVSESEYKFLEEHLETYYKTLNVLNEMTHKHGFIQHGMPIKLQSLKEKRLVIKNFDQCIEWYNNWVDRNGFGTKVTSSQLVNDSDKEEAQLNLPIAQSAITFDKQNTIDHLRLS